MKETQQTEQTTKQAKPPRKNTEEGKRREECREEERRGEERRREESQTRRREGGNKNSPKTSRAGQPQLEGKRERKKAPPLTQQNKSTEKEGKTIIQSIKQTNIGTATLG
jgi:hypothetical protein